MRKFILSVGLVFYVLGLGSLQVQAGPAKRAGDQKSVAASAKRPSAQAKSSSVKAKSSAKAKLSSKTKPKLHSTAKRKPAARAQPPVRVEALTSPDFLALKSSAAFVIDQETQEVLLSKNDRAVLPIASLTKLMTGLVLIESNLPMDDLLTITQADVDTEKGSTSRLRVGTTLSRGELLHLALMSSENRAAHALGRTYPGGLPAFVAAMNAKAHQLGMVETTYREPTGLSDKNQSSARDLAKLVDAASNNTVLRELSTSPGYKLEVGDHTLQFSNTNRLVKSPRWDIGVQKTGYISEAGQCLVMQAKVAGRKLIMVFLDSMSKYARIADAERVRYWVEAYHGVTASHREAPQMSLGAARPL